MASLNFHNGIANAFKGNVDFDTDSFKVMLVTSSYTPDKDLHDYRNDVTNEVSGTGYSAGGASVTVSVSVDTTNDRIDVQFSSAAWATSSITARGAVYYKARGGASSADEIICYDDFGADYTSSGGTFNLAATTLRITN